MAGLAGFQYRKGNHGPNSRSDSAGSGTCIPSEAGKATREDDLAKTGLRCGQLSPENAGLREGAPLGGTIIGQRLRPLTAYVRLSSVWRAARRSSTREGAGCRFGVPFWPAKAAGCVGAGGLPKWQCRQSDAAVNLTTPKWRAKTACHTGSRPKWQTPRNG